MTAEDDMSEPSRFVDGAVPLRLTVPGDDVGAGHLLDEEGDLAQARATALDWQRAAEHADVRESSAVVCDLERGRMYHLVRHVAAAGEKLALACTAAVECALWVERRAAPSAPAPTHEEVGWELAHRAVAELHTHYLLGTGHDLINITARVLALDSELGDPLRGKFKTTFQVSDDGQSKYLPINKPKAEELGEVANLARGYLLRRVAEPVCRLVEDPSWESMVGFRNEHFHRVRPQSHGTSGLGPQDPWEDDGDDITMTIGVPRDYREAAGLAAEMTRVNRMAQHALVAAMKDFWNRFDPAVEEIMARSPRHADHKPQNENAAREAPEGQAAS